MKHKWINSVLAVLLAAAIACLSICLANRGIPRLSLNLAMRAYEAAFDDGAPDDLKLTIYYLHPCSWTRAPIWKLEQLDDNMAGSEKIVVGAEELLAHAEQFGELNADGLYPQSVFSAFVSDDMVIGQHLRMGYILEREDGEILLKVYTYDLLCSESVIVNGIKVKNDPIFYELIDPYLTDADRETLRAWEKY